MNPPATTAAWSENGLLHDGAPASAWGNLGWWTDETATAGYAAAARALAVAVGDAAALAAGDHVLSLGCGAGEELRLWCEHFGVAEAVGVEADPEAAHRAHALARRAGLGARVTVLGQSALPDHSAFAPDDFDAVVAVDAAYHFSPRRSMLLSAYASLKPGGRLAYTDLARTRGGPSALALRWILGRGGLDGRELSTLEEQQARLVALGFDDVRGVSLGREVLDGFARFARQQAQRLGARAQGAAWRRVAATARLIGPCRTLGLDYVLLSARKAGAPS